MQCLQQRVTPSAIGHRKDYAFRRQLQLVTPFINHAMLLSLQTHYLDPLMMLRAIMSVGTGGDKYTLLNPSPTLPAKLQGPPIG